jgi:hypothetical protein
MSVQMHLAALKDPKTFFEAVKVLKAMGEEAIPVLAHALNDDTLYPNLSSDPGKYDNMREAIVRALEELGPLSRSAIPDLIQAFEDERMKPYVGMRHAAVIALVKVAPSDEKVIAALVNALRTSIAVHAAFALGEAGAYAKSALPALIDALASSTARYSRRGRGDIQDMMERANAHELMVTIQQAIKKIQTSA